MSMIPRTFRFDKYSFNPNKALEESSASESVQGVEKGIQTDLKKKRDPTKDLPQRNPDQFRQQQQQKEQEWANSSFKVRSLWKTSEDTKLLQSTPKILLGFDDSNGSRKALGAGLALAKKLDCPVTVAQIITQEIQDAEKVAKLHEGLVKKMNAVFAKFFSAEFIKEHQPHVRTLAHPNEAEGLLQIAQIEKCSLLLLGDGKNPNAGLASFSPSSNLLLKIAPLPVLVWPQERDSVALKNIMVAFDGTPQSYPAISQALMLAQPLGAQLTLFHVHPEGVEPEAATANLNQLMQKVNWQNVPHQVIASSGRVTSEILIHCKKQKIDLLVMGPSLISAQRVGTTPSITLDVLERIKCPVLAVHGHG